MQWSAPSGGGDCGRRIYDHSSDRVEEEVKVEIPDAGVYEGLYLGCVTIAEVSTVE